MLKDISYEYNRDNETSPLCWESTNDCCLPHFHSSIEILYVIDGEVKATLNGQVYLVKQMDFLIIPSYTIHANSTEQYSKSYIFTIPLDSIPSYKTLLTKKTFANLLVEKPQCYKELEHCLEFISSSCYNVPSIRLLRGEDASIINSTIVNTNSDNTYTNDDLTMNNFISEDTNSLLQENIIKGYTYIFLGLLIKQVGVIDISNTKMTSLTQEILIYLQNNFLKCMSLEEIANHFGYSKSRFSHIFNDYFGCSLIEYINSLRCRYAIELLEEKKVTITEIALASGFESTRTFYRAFQKCFGCTPSQYLLK